MKAWKRSSTAIANQLNESARKVTAASRRVNLVPTAADNETCRQMSDPRLDDVSGDRKRDVVVRDELTSYCGAHFRFRLGADVFCPLRAECGF